MANEQRGAKDSVKDSAKDGVKRVPTPGGKTPSAGPLTIEIRSVDGRVFGTIALGPDGKPRFGGDDTQALAAFWADFCRQPARRGTTTEELLREAPRVLRGFTQARIVDASAGGS